MNTEPPANVRTLVAGVLAAALAPAAGAGIDVPAASADRIVTGAAAGDNLGRGVAFLGDVNDDGWSEYAVSSFGPGGGGRVTVYDGRSGGIVYALDGEAAGDSFGEALAPAGDVNGDGRGDLIVGAWANDAGGAAAGRAYVFDGPGGALLHTFTGEAAGDNLGDAVGGAGDVDADGRDDVVIGAPTHDGNGLNAGRVYVYSGADWSSLHVLDGETPLDRLGVEVSSAGDTNGDGYADIIAGAHLYGLSTTSSDNPGRAYVFSGDDGTVLRHFTGEAPGDNFGWSVDTAGDVNGDGFADVIIGAPLNDALGSNTGRVYVYAGSTWLPLGVYTGEAASDKLGLSVSHLGDYDGDGFDDVLAGAWWNDAGGAPGDDLGRAYVWSGQGGTLLRSFTGEAIDDSLGRPVHAGDLNGDGAPDVLTGARENDAGGSDAGRAYVFVNPNAPCAGDLDGNGTVGFNDLSVLLAAWGPCPPARACPADGTDDGVVGFADLNELLGGWGPCP